MLKLTKRFEFSASHSLEQVKDNKEQVLHGHDFIIEITLGQKATNLKDGMILESRNFHIDILPVLKSIEGKNLNEFIANPTLENLTFWFWARLQFMNNGNQFSLCSIKIYLNETLWCEIDG